MLGGAGAAGRSGGPASAPEPGRRDAEVCHAVPAGGDKPPGRGGEVRAVSGAEQGARAGEHGGRKAGFGGVSQRLVLE